MYILVKVRKNVIRRLLLWVGTAAVKATGISPQLWRIATNTDISKSQTRQGTTTILLPPTLWSPILGNESTRIPLDYNYHDLAVAETALIKAAYMTWPCVFFWITMELHLLKKSNLKFCFGKISGISFAHSLQQ